MTKKNAGPYVFTEADLPKEDQSTGTSPGWDELEAKILGGSLNKGARAKKNSGDSSNRPLDNESEDLKSETIQRDSKNLDKNIDDNDSAEEWVGNERENEWPESTQSVGTIQENVPQLDLSRTLTDDEYLDLLSELNEDAENKNYVFIFGLPGSGKSFIIASLLKYMEQCDLGQSRLDVDRSTVTERKLYNRMIMAFTDPKNYKIESNATLDFNRFNIVFTPKGNKPEKTITFLDVSGEACQAIYQGDSSKYTGELPDFLRVVLESDINSTFLMVGEYQDPKAKNSHAMQDQILKAFYDKILSIQSKENKKYHKILLISKWDRLSTAEREEFDVVDYVEKYLPATWNNFRVENYNGKVLNSIAYYSVGEFKGDRLMKINNERPEALFNSIYEGITGITLKKSEPFLSKIKKYLMGTN